MKIANKINLSFFMVVLVLTIIGGTIFYLTAKDNLQKAIYSNLAAVLASRVDHVETYLKMLEISVGQLSKSVVLDNFLKISGKEGPQQNEAFEQAMRRLERTKEANSAIAEFLLMNKRGSVVVSSDKSSIGSDESTDSIFLGAQKGIYLKDVYYSERYEEPLMAVSAPILDSVTGELSGVLAARVRLTDLNKIVANRTGMGDTGEIYIVNEYGYMITPSRFEKGTVLKQKVDSENARKARLHKDRAHVLPNDKLVGIYIDYLGELGLGAHEYIPQMRWAVIAEIDEKEALSPLIKIRLVFLMILFIAPITAWLLGVFIAGAITDPLHRLHKGTEIIGSGDLDYRVGTTSKDEIGQLSRAFDTMTQGLKKTTTSVENLDKEIVERRKAEESLRESERKIRALFDQSFQFIGMMTPDGTLIEANRTAMHFAGINESDCLGKPFWDTPWWTHSAEMQNKLREAVIKVARGETVRFEATHPAADGSIHYIDFSLKPVQNENGKIIFLMPEGRDITERKRSEEELSKAYSDLKMAQAVLVESEKMSALGRFSTGAAHEIKNPLAMILSGTELLEMRSHGADKEIVDITRRIKNAVLRIDKIINALVMFSDSSEVLTKKVALGDILDEALLLTESKIRGRQIRILKELEEGLYINVNYNQVLHAILNILTNAVDATAALGKITVKGYREIADGPSQGVSKCVVEINDTGEGISEDNLPKIYEPFFTTRRDKKQVGLGLTVARASIKNNKGDIFINSPEGRGAEVKISFPMLAQ